MLIFAYPWCFLALPAPWLLWRVASPHREPRAGLSVPFLEELARLTGQQPAAGTVVLRGGAFRRVLLGVIWLGFVAAMARPQLVEAQVRMAGPNTALGDAIGLAITLFERGDAQERTLIALTDGNDTASQVPPARAADIARDKGIVIHTVAVGDPKAAGEEALDEEALKTIADATGGLCSFGADRAQLGAIYDRLDALQTREANTVTFRPRRDLYAWPLGAAFVLSLLQQALVAVIDARRRAERRAPDGQARYGRHRWDRLPERPRPRPRPRPRQRPRLRPRQRPRQRPRCRWQFVSSIRGRVAATGRAR